MIDARHLRDHVIVPVLEHLGPRYASPLAVNLLLGTCAQESAMGRYLVQLRGPAQGIFQMEPRTHDDLYNTFLINNVALFDKVMELAAGPADNPTDCLTGNLYYAAAMTRIFYWRIPAALPSTLEGQAAYWKRYYNTAAGRGTTEEYIAHWAEFVAPQHAFN